jgi:hypothetical protein
MTAHLPTAALVVISMATASAQPQADAQRWRADFAKTELPQPLQVLREDRAAYRLGGAEGALVISTRRGDIYQNRNDCANLFWVPAPAGDFEAVLRVRRFEPSRPVQHLSLGLFQDEDKLVRVTYWWRGADRGVHLDREDVALQRNLAGEAADFAQGPFRLRLVCRGTQVSAAFAPGEEPWRECGALEWDGLPRFLGFYAANSDVPDCPATEASISAFEVTSAQPLPAQMPALPPPPKPTLHAYTDYGWLRGLNCIPSWGARIEEAWWRYDPQAFRAEMALVQQMHGNCVRLWLEFTAWMAEPDQVTASFLDAIAAIDEAGMKAMPCLFNRWHDNGWDYGGTYVEDLRRDWGPKLGYVRAAVAPLASDPRVLCWDLCNEPQAFALDSDENRREFAFLQAVAATARAAGVRQPITIGTMVGSNIELYAPLCDVLCAHPYARSQADLAAAIEALAALSRRLGKPLLVNECIPGCLDDGKRAQAARYGSEMLAAAGFGWMGWSVREGKAIATRRDRIDGNGVDGTGFHAWFTRAGQLRPGLEFLLETPARRPPWAGR